MQRAQETFVRKEFKYFVPWSMIGELRERVLRHAVYDSFCVAIPGHCYQVRSIYLDTPRRLFYYEKIDGTKIRKKLRIRTYNRLEDHAAAFVEIKRKFDDSVFKERAQIALEEAPMVLNGAADDWLNGSNRSSTAMHHFIYLVRSLNLLPRVLVTYEREAFFGLDDTEVRITFDMNTRSYSEPTLEDMFRDDDMRQVKQSHFILEIKYYNRMPSWARQIVRDYRLRRDAISKYCRGIDAWEEVAA